MGNKGFSLVELSIVLIIIGLLVAGATSGGKLIEQAKIRKYISTINNLDSSIYSFKITYEALPGDFSEANNFGLGADGNGNGIIDNYSNTESTLLMWQHLESEGYIEKYKYASGNYYMGIQNGNTDIMFWKDRGVPIVGSTFHPNLFDDVIRSKMLIVSASHTKLSSSSNTYYGMSAQKSYFIDKKMDDGVVETGYIFADLSVGTVTNEGDCGSATTYDIATNSDCFLFYDFPSLRTEDF